MTNDTPLLTEEAVLAWARLVRVSGRLLHQVEADLSAAGMPPLAWYDALLELKRAEPNGLRPYQLQQEILLTQYNLSRLLDRLVTAGNAQRYPCNQDGRGHIVRITDQGRQLLRRMWPVYRQAIADRFANRLNHEQTVALAEILLKLRD